MLTSIHNARQQQTNVRTRSTRDDAMHFHWPHVRILALCLRKTRVYAYIHTIVCYVSNFHIAPKLLVHLMRTFTHTFTCSQQPQHDDDDSRSERSGERETVPLTCDGTVAASSELNDDERRQNRFTMTSLAARPTNQHHTNQGSYFGSNLFLHCFGSGGLCCGT